MKSLLLVMSLLFSVSLFAHEASKVKCSIHFTEASYYFNLEFKTPSAVKGIYGFTSGGMSGWFHIPDGAMKVVKTEEYRIVKTNFTAWDFSLRSISIPNEVLSNPGVEFRTDFETPEGMTAGSCTAE